MGDGDLGDQFLLGSVKDVYIFDAMLLKNGEYDPGEKMVLQFILNPIGKGFSGAARINYQVFYYGENEADAQLVSDIPADQIRADEGGSYLKRIDLKKDAMPGGYILKVSAEIGNNQYVQSVRFSVSSKPVIQIGSTIVTKEKLANVVTIDIIAILVVILAVTIIVMWEYKRFLLHSPINEKTLRRKGYFTK